MGDLVDSMRISAAGMKAQGTRLRIVAENLANADSTGRTPAEAPYRRKVATFKNELDRATGLDQVRIDRIKPDSTPFGKRFDPGHPAADADGYVQTPNVNSLIEMMDMREAERSYEANMNMVKSAKRMVTDTIDLLR